MCGSDYPFDMGLAQPLDFPRSVDIYDAPSKPMPAASSH